MSRMAELDADRRQQDDPAAALYHDLLGALTRVARGTTTTDDARLLCYALGIDPLEIGLFPKHARVAAFDLL